MPKFEEKDFPILLAPFATFPKWHERTVEGLATLSEGLEADTIRKVHLDGAKSNLNRAVDKAWDHHVCTPHVFGGKINELPQDVRKFYYDIRISGLYSLRTAARKLAACEIDHPIVTAMKEVVDEANALGEASRYLATVQVKGRAPAQPKPVNPNQERGTCSCCQRDIAVKGQGMAHHGYQRPGDGYQTLSCEGTNFPNLEKSLEGLHFMIRVVDQRLEGVKLRLSKVDEVTKLNDPFHKPRHGELPKYVKKGEDRFPYLLSCYKSNLKAEVKACEKHQEYLGETLKTWEEYHEKKREAEPSSDAETPSP